MNKEIIKYLKNSIDEKDKGYCYSLPVKTTKAVIKELNRLNNIIDDLEKVKKVYDIKYRENKALKEQVLLYKIVLDKIKQYCDDEKEDLIAGAEVCEDVLKIIEEIK